MLALWVVREIVVWHSLAGHLMPIFAQECTGQAASAGKMAMACMPHPTPRYRLTAGLQAVEHVLQDMAPVSRPDVLCAKGFC